MSTTTWGGKRENAGRKKKVFYLVNINTPNFKTILADTDNPNHLASILLTLYGHLGITEQDIQVTPIEPIQFN